MEEEFPDNSLRKMFELTTAAAMYNKERSHRKVKLTGSIRE
jgi:hypothetical protein